MTAPKPRVRFRRGCDGSGLWAWDCDCGAGGEFCDTSLLVNACDAAAYHSRTHAAERIADELDRRKVELRDTAPTQRNGGLDNSYDYGSATAYERAATLIREHLA